MLGGYDFVPEKLWFLAQEKKRYKVIKGGRGSAKSETCGRSLIDMAYKKKMKILCARNYQTSIKYSVHSLLQRIIIKNNLQHFFQVYETKIVGANGSEFIFNGLQNINSIKSIDEVDICWVTEASDVTKSNFEKLTPSIRKKGSEIWLDFNPESEDDYVWQRFCHKKPLNYETSRVICVTINWEDNPFFNAELEMERQETLTKYPEDYDHVWGGELRTISDAQVFKGRFTIKEFDDPEPEDIDYNRFFQGADFGFARDPATMVRQFIRTENGQKNLYISHEAYGVGVETNELSALYSSIPDARKWPTKGDSARPETISYLAQPYDEERDEKGFNIEACAKWAGSVEDGIAYLKSFDNIFIHPRCVNTAREFRLYAYKIDKISGKILPVIVDKNNHCIDAVRYGIDDYIKDSLAQESYYDEDDNIDTVVSKLNW